MVYTDWSDAISGTEKAGPGIRIAFSPDGRVWTEYKKTLFPQNWSRIAAGMTNLAVPANTDPVNNINSSPNAWRIPLSMSVAPNLFLEPLPPGSNPAWRSRFQAAAARHNG